MQRSDANSEASSANNSPADSDAGGDLRPGYKAPRSARRTETVPTDDQKNGKGAQKGKGEGEKPESVLNLRDLFRVREDGDEGADDEDRDPVLDLDEPDDPSKPVKTIDQLSKRLKAKAEDIYAIEVPMKFGDKPMTIGDLKDRVGELVNLDARELEFDTRRIQKEGELLRAQSEMRELMALIPRDKLSLELIDKVRRKHEATQQNERRLTLEAIPEWNDEQTRTQELAGIVEMFRDYGFDDSFVTTISDHRAMKFVRDMWRIRKRVMNALKDVKIPPRKSQQRPSARRASPEAPRDRQQSRRTVATTERSRLESFLNSGNS